MYISSSNFQRTSDEKSDLFLSWNRPDKNFFAAGACHILAYLFIQLHPNEGYKINFIKPNENFPGNHLYVSDGTWAFDFNGWTLEKELLEETMKSYFLNYPEWNYEKIEITHSLDDFCKKHNHRMPYEFAYLPWERAYNYIKSFPSSPES